MVVLVDRESGAKERLTKAGYTFRAVLTIGDLLNHWEQNREGWSALYKLHPEILKRESGIIIYLPGMSLLIPRYAKDSFNNTSKQHTEIMRRLDKVYDDMLEINIPGQGKVEIKHLVCDVNGTLATDGILIDGICERSTNCMAIRNPYSHRGYSWDANANR